MYVPYLFFGTSESVACLRRLPEFCVSALSAAAVSCEGVPVLLDFVRRHGLLVFRQVMRPSSHTLHILCVVLQTAIMLSPRRAPLLQKELHGAMVRHGALSMQHNQASFTKPSFLISRSTPPSFQVRII